MISSLLKSNVIVSLMFFSVIGPFISFFGFHYLYLTSIIIPGLFFFIFHHFTVRQKAGYLFSILLITMIFFSVFNISKGYGYVISMINDLATTGFFLLPFFLGKIGLNKLKSFFLGILSISFLMFFFVILNFGISSLFVESSRDVIYKELMSRSNDIGFSSAIDLTSVTSFCIGYTIISLLFLPFFLNQISKSKYLIIIIIVILQFVIYEIINQKRQIIVELGLIFFFAQTLNKRLFYKTFFSNWAFRALLVIVFFSFMLSNDLVILLFNRFKETSENISEFDRLEEAKDVLTEFSFINYFFGNGFGWLAKKAVSTGETMHIGYMNLLSKGGAMYIIFYLGQIIFNIIYCGNRLKSFPIYSVGITFSVFSLIQLSFAPGYGWYFNSLITGMGMFSRFFLDDLKRSYYTIKNKALI
jgi:hypothetical protein